MRTISDWRTHNDIQQPTLSDKASSQRTLSKLALAAIVLASGWTAWTYMSGGSEEAVASFAERQTLSMDSEVHHSAVANAYARLSNALKNQARRSAAAITNEVALFDSRFSLGYPPGTFSVAAVMGKADRGPQVTASLADTGVAPTPEASPKPTLRERVMAKAASAAKLLRSTRSASRDVAQANAAADTQERAPSIFEKLFGKPQPVTLAYASPEDGSIGLGAAGNGRYDRYTAVYDISAHTVYLPDGTQLEAHSGLGARMDDPRYVHERMHGPTPPTVYDLKMREAPFHGVKAIRLIPVDEEGALGRTGLLAHTYMLGTRGDSNGCVSFRDYNAFLQAYQSQKIKRLAVVTHL
jgi:type VI secretion system (T6SS) effector TldE1-like protein